ncbi:hypothetical protein [Corynebacterium sp.]|uniref:hypothetical protein n=1 Tax=Corynebacterium sp. TaxID=1720 RepID=UPI0026E0F913|nr:hypothetical protein [Corynebacterium sp.]MDO5512951.1 hypothetical protein [Corynebacterium sp.]
MAALALLFAILALIAAPMSIVAGVVLLALTLGAGVARTRRRPGRRILAVASVIALAAGGLLVFETWERYRPPGAAAVDTGAYDRPGTDREVWLPLTAARHEVTALALVEIEPDADPVYSSFEPQYIEREGERGYRVIAYRHDGYADFFDDLTLSPDPDLRSAVTGKGVQNYSHQDLGDPVIEVDGRGRVTIAFSLQDPEGRRVSVDIREGSTAGSVPFTLLAPVGMSSTHPELFPLFMINDLEFLRLRGLQAQVTIDGREVALQAFPGPVPVQGQLRSWVKYSLDAEIMEIFPTWSTTMTRVRTTGDRYDHDGSTYLFAGNALERIHLADTEIVFDPPLDIGQAGEGRVTMASHPDRGHVAGAWEISRDGGRSHLRLLIDDVEVPRQRGVLYRLIVNDRSQFAAWPKDYSLTATFDPAAGRQHAQWHNAGARE